MKTKQQRYFFEASSTADLNNHNAWILRFPNACRITSFQIAELVAPKVLVNALQIHHSALLNHKEIPGQVFRDGLALSVVCQVNMDLLLRIQPIVPLVLEDCDLVFTEGRGVRALAWVDVMEAA